MNITENLLAFLGISSGIGLLIGSQLSKKNKPKTKPQKAIWDDVTKRRIQTLHPKIREMATAFILDAQSQGIKLRVTSALRTFAEQRELYNQGRSTPGRKVTNATPGRSWHNYGLALDVVEIKEGAVLWDNPNWPRIGQIGKKHGFEWGGDWTSFQDKPHFEYSPFSTSEALRRYEGKTYIEL